nr:CUB domain-containing protein [Hydra vulgaris]
MKINLLILLIMIKKAYSFSCFKCSSSSESDCLATQYLKLCPIEKYGYACITILQSYETRTFENVSEITTIYEKNCLSKSISCDLYCEYFNNIGVCKNSCCYYDKCNFGKLQAKKFYRKSGTITFCTKIYMVIFLYVFRKVI